MLTPQFIELVFLFVFTVPLGPNVRFEDYEGATSYHKHLPEFVTNTNTRWWFQIFVMFTPILGEMIQFDGHIFQMGWFHHHLLGCPRKLGSMVRINGLFHLLINGV